MLHETPLVISIGFPLKASPVPFRSQCKWFPGFKYHVSMMDTLLNISILLLIFWVHILTSISFRHCDLISCSCLIFNSIKHRILYYICSFYLLDFVLFLLYWMQNTVAELFSWKMFKVEIDLVADEKRENETNEMYRWKQRLGRVSSGECKYNKLIKFIQMPDPRSYFSQHFAKNFVPT